MLDQQEDPLIAASLCCDFHGPNTNGYSMEYEGLTSVGAALKVQTSNELATELHRLYLCKQRCKYGHRCT